MGRPGRRRFTRIVGQFVPRPIDMLESPAYRVLTLAAHRVLARLEIEFAHHGGNDNGALPVTFGDFISYGIERHAVAPAIRELGALGIAEVSEHGRGGNAVFRSPAAGIATPIMGLEKLEWLLSIALKQMDEAAAAKDAKEYQVWFERATVLARSLTPFQTPQLRAIAVAHTGMKPTPVSLDRLSDKQLEQLRELLRLMAPGNVAREPPKG
jgi:hypothetical protein